jgi:hypothetical protein
VRRDGPLDRARIVTLMSQLAEGVSAVHARGLIHRDIKPANVILHDDGTPRLVDFGLAAPLCGERLGRPGGSPMYMAPEQARLEKDRIDFRTDVFGLGGVLYELLTGHPPHEAATRAELEKQAREGIVIPPRKHDPKIPKPLERLCLKALAAAPENRYTSADEFRQALGRYANRNQRAAALMLSALALAGLAVAVFGPWSKREGSPAVQPLASGPIAGEPARAGTPPPSSENVRILDLELEHHPKTDQKTYRADLARRIGVGSFAARFDDEVTIRAKLSEPAYSFLIAFAPDGSIVLCDPREESARPRLTREPSLPAEAQGDSYYLNEGTGLQAFAVVVSRKPLPAFAELIRQHGRPPWPAGPVPGAPGVVWSHDGQWLTARDRDNTAGTRAIGKSRKATGGGAHVEDLAHWLHALPGVEAARVEAFTVEPAS